jgi:hypothetical protein
MYRDKGQAKWVSINFRGLVTVRIQTSSAASTAGSRNAGLFRLRITTAGAGVLALVAVLMFTAACGGNGVHSYAAEDIEPRKVRRVAVFPFFNQTSFSEAGRIVTNAYIAQMVAKTDYQVEFPGNIRNFLISERIIIRNKIDLTTIELMRRRLGVDAVVLGEVIEYSGPKKARASDVPLVHVGVRMVEAETGRILFMANHRKTGDDYRVVLDIGKIRSTSALAEKVVGEIVDKMP